MLTRSVAAMVAALFSTCTQINPLARQPARKICPDGVALYAGAGSVPSVYKEIALLPAKEPRREAPGQRQQAGDLGANGIILTSGTEDAGTKMMGAAIGDYFERQGKMVAIYVPGDTARVLRACWTASGQKPSDRITYPVAVIGTMSSSPKSSTSRPPRPEATYQGPRTRPFDLSGRETDAAETLTVLPDPDDRSVFSRNADVRAAINNLIRLHLITGAEEVRPGLVRLSIAGLQPRAQLEYHVSILQGAYQAALPFRHAGVVELWTDGAKLGEYTSDGLFLGGGASKSR